MKKILISLALFFSMSVFGQEPELYKVSYIDRVQDDSVMRNVKKNIKMSTEAIVDSVILKSRLGKIKAKCYLDNNVTNGILRCINIAINVLEDRLVIDKPFLVNFKFDNSLDENIEVQTTVFYALKNQTVYPLSLYKQLFSNNTPTRVAEIDFNPSVDWDYSWPDDSKHWDSNNMISEILRQMAHALGFGTSISKKANGKLECAVRDVKSPFDNIITDGSTKLSQVSDYESFFKRKIYVETVKGRYPLFSALNDFVSNRSGCYFSLDEDNLMNYPYKDKTELLNINSETLDVLSEIGWKTKDYDMTICADNLNSIYFGNAFDDITFSVVDSKDNLMRPIKWTFNAFSNVKNNYETFYQSTEQKFSLVPGTFGSDYVDDNSYLQGNITCFLDQSGVIKEYCNAIFLDCRPLVKKYTINNVVKNQDGKSFDFDINISQKGGEHTLVMVTTESGTIKNSNLNLQEDIVIHVDNAPIKGLIYVNISSENEYGITDRDIEFSYNSLCNPRLGLRNEFINVNDFFNINKSFNTINYYKKINNHEN